MAVSSSRNLHDYATVLCYLTRSGSIDHDNNIILYHIIITFTVIAGNVSIYITDREFARGMEMCLYCTPTARFGKDTRFFSFDIIFTKYSVIKGF